MERELMGKVTKKNINEKWPSIGLVEHCLPRIWEKGIEPRSKQAYVFKGGNDSSPAKRTAAAVSVMGPLR